MSSSISHYQFHLASVWPHQVWGGRGGGGGAYCQATHHLEPGADHLSIHVQAPGGNQDEVSCGEVAADTRFRG